MDSEEVFNLVEVSSTGTTLSGEGTEESEDVSIVGVVSVSFIGVGSGSVGVISFLSLSGVRIDSV
jgi:hypothetical protein